MGDDVTALGWPILVAGLVMFLVGYSMTKEEGWFGKLGTAIEGLGVAAMGIGALIIWG